MVSCSPAPGLCPVASLPKTINRLLATYESALIPARLTATQFVLLSEIGARKTDLPQIAELSRTLLIDRLRLNRSLRTLERDGFVRFVVNGGERRSSRVELTAAGLAKLRQASPLWQYAQAQWDATLGKQLAADLRDTLTLIASLDLVASLNFKTPLL